MRYLAALLLALVAPLAIASPSLAFDPLQPACNGAAKNSPVCQPPKQENPIVHTINVAVKIMSILVGIFAVIMIIIGGLTMATAAGNSEKLAKARARVIYSLVALVVAALAWTIVTFIVNRITT